jgi:hypothetical protein
VNSVLLLSLMMLLCSALPWWPNSAYGKSRHRRVLDSPSRTAEARPKRVGRGPAPAASREARMKLFDGSETHQMHIYGTKKSTAGTPVYITLAILVFVLWIFDTETWLQHTLLLSLALTLTLFFSPMFGSRKEERGKENTTQQNADGTSEPAGDNGSPAKKERRVIQSGLFEGKSFSIFDDGSIEIQTGSGIKQFKDFAELRAVAAAKHGYDASGRTEARS